MNINDAVAAKLKGKTIDCRNCRYWMRFQNEGLYCARNKQIKTDTTMCQHFDGMEKMPRHYKHVKNHSVFFSFKMSLKSVHKAARRFEALNNES